MYTMSRTGPGTPLLHSSTFSCAGWISIPRLLLEARPNTAVSEWTPVTWPYQLDHMWQEKVAVKSLKFGGGVCSHGNIYINQCGDRHGKREMRRTYFVSLCFCVPSSTLLPLILLYPPKPRLGITPHREDCETVPSWVKYRIYMVDSKPVCRWPLPNMWQLTWYICIKLIYKLKEWRNGNILNIKVESTSLLENKELKVSLGHEKYNTLPLQQNYILQAFLLLYTALH